MTSEHLVKMDTYSDATDISNTTDTWLDNSSHPPIETGVEERLEAILVPVIFAIIFIIGVVGNVTLITIVLRNEKMRNTPNIFVVSLSVGDLLLLLFSVPFSSTLFTLVSWPFGTFVCKLNKYMQTLSLGVSVFTLTALSGDRYIAIVHPMSRHATKPTLITVLIVLGIWTLSALLAIPDAYTPTIALRPGQNGKTLPICEDYPDDFPEWYSKAHTIVLIIVFFFLPVTIIGLFYGLMARILFQSSRDMPCETMNASMNQQQQRQINARIKVAKIVMSFIVIFVLCWAPRHAYLLAANVIQPHYNMFWHVLQIVSYCLMFVYSCVNPYALWFLSSQFRKYYNRYLFCCCPKFKYGPLPGEQSHMYHFNSTVRRNSTTYTGVAHSQSMC